MRVKHLAPLLLVLLLIALFFLPVVAGEKGFYAGDHKDQHYPFWVYFSSQIKAGSFPGWTPLITAGFPLAAEGQIAALYPVNYLFTWLPSEIGFNANILFHFFLGAVLFYLFAVNLPLTVPAALFATLIYVFGSARAGFYYNMTSQRVLIWFPLSLLLVDLLFKRRNVWLVLGLGLVFCLEIVAGYQQYAGYAVGITVIYAATRAFLCRAEASSKVFFPLVLLSAVLGVLLSFPQTLPFLQLLKASCRVELPEAFAYVGSTNPLGLIALYYPDLDDFFSSELYTGILPLFFVIVALFSLQKNQNRLFLVMALLTYALALGVFNPLFILFVKLTGFGGRVPSKFLYFTSTFLALLAGIGMEHFLKGLQENVRAKAVKLFTFLSLGAILVVGGMIAGLRIFKSPVMAFGKFLVDRFIIGSPVHTHSAETYYQKLEAFYEALLFRFSPVHFYTIVFTVLIILAVFLVRRLKPVKSGYIWILAFLMIDFFAFAQHSVFGNLKPKAVIQTPSAILETLQADKDFYRIFTLTEDGSLDNYPVYSDYNLALNIPDTGGYSPLLLKSYFDYLQPLGSLNNSLEVSKGNVQNLGAYRARLNFLGVKYLLTKVPLDSSFTLIQQENNVYLYRNPEAKGGVFFFPESPEKIKSKTIAEIEALASPQSELPVQSRLFSGNQIRIEVNAPAAGTLLITAAAFPGWTASVNGTQVTWDSAAGLFILVPVTQGQNQIELNYSYAKSIQEFFRG